MLQIDVNKPNIKDVRESYDVTTVPSWLSLRQELLYWMKIQHTRLSIKFYKVLNMNPTAVHPADVTTSKNEKKSAFTEKPAKPA